MISKVTGKSFRFFLIYPLSMSSPMAFSIDVLWVSGMALLRARCVTGLPMRSMAEYTFLIMVSVTPVLLIVYSVIHSPPMVSILWPHSGQYPMNGVSCLQTGQSHASSMNET